ncbi:septation protein SpoVG family protein [Candidatus Bipolaricaulota bacterium]
MVSPNSSFPRARDQLHGFIHSANIVQDSLRVAMPSREMKNGRSRNTAYPTDNEFRVAMEFLILDKYYSFMNQTGTLLSSEIHTEDATF